MSPKMKTAGAHPVATSRTVPASAYRAEWDRRDRIPAIADVLSGRLSYLDTCRQYDIQSNQLYAWAGKAIINAEPEAVAALAANAELMARLTALATSAGAPVLPTGAELERALGRLLLAGRSPAVAGPVTGARSGRIAVKRTTRD